MDCDPYDFGPQLLNVGKERMGTKKEIKVDRTKCAGDHRGIDKVDISFASLRLLDLILIN